MCLMDTCLAFGLGCVPDLGAACHDGICQDLSNILCRRASYARLIFPLVRVQNVPKLIRIRVWY